MPDDNYTSPKLATAVQEIEKAGRILERIESHMTQRMAALALTKGNSTDQDRFDTARFNELKDLLRVIQSVR